MEKCRINNEVFRHFLNCRRAGKLASLGEENNIFSHKSQAEEHFKQFCIDTVIEEEKHNTLKFIRSEVFSADELTANTDLIIFRPNGETILVTVKYSARFPNSNDFNEVAFISYILKLNSIVISEYWYIIINKNYVKGEKLTQDLMLVLWVKNRVKSNGVTLKTSVLKQTLKKTEIPPPELGTRCLNPRCPNLKNCFPYEKSLLNLSSMSIKKKLQVSWENGVDLNKLDSDTNLSKQQWEEVINLRSNGIKFNKSRVKNFLKGIGHIDSVGFLLLNGIHTYYPIYTGCKPFNIVFFQYDLLVKESYDDKFAEHSSGFNKSPLDILSVKIFFENFLNDLEQRSVSIIITYNKARVIEMLETVITILPEKKKIVANIQDKLLDLQHIFSTRMYQNPKLLGSTYIEDVIPDMSKGLNWEPLNVKSYKSINSKVVYGNLQNSDKHQLTEIFSLLNRGLLIALDTLLNFRPTRKSS